ncbi:MAG: transcription termination/antitermination factor NusG [Candidatus Dadabacteria bacterium]|nr:transcription termination/antitermination factor NusG [Candidatus Dadabacteria bacterium]NIQ15735.1 transcription termination/antitermination factor NusG [Candidatus Dadabacteria bacterium]
MSSKWYIVHVNTGFEDRVKSQIEDQAINRANNDLDIEEVLVPTESIVETQKGGKKKTSVRKFFPGYILIKMDLNERTWHFIRNIPKVISFVGGRPKDGVIDANSVPDVKEEEVMRIKTQIQEGTLKPKPKVAFEKGETIKVIEGPFANFSGTIEEIKPEKAKVQVLVTIFGRTTPIELDFNQVEKI